MEHPVLRLLTCSQLVRFALRHDHAKVFRFASLQSSFGSLVFKQHGVDGAALTTVYVLASGEEGQVLLQRSEAILFLIDRFGRIWSVLARMARLLPFGIRNWAYNLVASISNFRKV